MTTRVHGEGTCRRAEAASAILFGGGELRDADAATLALVADEVPVQPAPVWPSALLARTRPQIATQTPNATRRQRRRGPKPDKTGVAQTRSAGIGVVGWAGHDTTRIRVRAAMRASSHVSGGLRPLAL